MTPEQRKMLQELHGISDQILKGHFLNVHFRAFRLADEAWKEHVRMNAIAGSRASNSPGGAVLDPERDGSFDELPEKKMYIPWKLSPESDPQERWIVTTADGEDEVECGYLTESEAIALADKMNREA